MGLQSITSLFTAKPDTNITKCRISYFITFSDSSLSHSLLFLISVVLLLLKDDSTYQFLNVMGMFPAAALKG
jgi:hypothetical protein